MEAPSKNPKCPIHPTYKGINRPKSLQPMCLCPSVYIVRMYDLLCNTVNQQDAVKNYICTIFTAKSTYIKEVLNE